MLFDYVNNFSEVESAVVGVSCSFKNCLQSGFISISRLRRCNPVVELALRRRVIPNIMLVSIEQSDLSELLEGKRCPIKI